MKTSVKNLVTRARAVIEEFDADGGDLAAVIGDLEMAVEDVEKDERKGVR